MKSSGREDTKPVSTVVWPGSQCVQFPVVKSEDQPPTPPTPSKKKKKVEFKREIGHYLNVEITQSDLTDCRFAAKELALGTPKSNYVTTLLGQAWNVTLGKWKSHHAVFMLQGSSDGRQAGTRTGQCLWLGPVEKVPAWWAAPNSRSWVRFILTGAGCIELLELNDSDITSITELTLAWVYAH